ncbi:MAG: phospholipase domain-containing protein [Chitinophagaceae bacterium]
MYWYNNKNAYGVRPVLFPMNSMLMEAYYQKPRFFKIKFCAGNTIFGLQSAGVPFLVYAHMREEMNVRSYAVSAGDLITDEWNIQDFTDGIYHLSYMALTDFSGNSAAAREIRRLQ